MHRQRVKVADGKYRWVQGNTHDELNDNIVKAYVESGRINEFISLPVTNSGVETNFREFAEEWYSTYKTGLKQTSLKDYRYQLDHLLYPVFGDMTLQSITVGTVQNFLNDHCHVAQSTIRKSLLVLDQLFKLALKQHLVVDNPIDTKILKVNSVPPQKRESLSPEEYADILNHLDDIANIQDRRMLALMLLTGMRRGEVLGLQWSDIDFDQRLIHIRRNVTFPDNAPVIGTPKTENGERIIPLDARLGKYLSPVETSGYVVGGKSPISKSSFTKSWRRIISAIDVHNATPHVFRHTYATALNNAGVPMKTIQMIMGHADITTTMNIYTHVDTTNILDAGEMYYRHTA